MIWGRPAAQAFGKQAFVPRPHRRLGAAWKRAALAGSLVFGLALPGAVRAEDAANEVCAPDISAGQFDVSVIGPKIAGNWQGKAPGLGFTTGVQTFPVEISYQNGRLYYGSGGVKVELRPVYDTRKPLRYDFVKQKRIPEDGRATELSLEEMSVVTNCELPIAPQFTWEYGAGDRRSSGVLSFLEGSIAVGTMWNSAGGTREVMLLR